MSRADQDTARSRELAAPAARGALFLVYVWFGLLKICGTSPAAPLVESLQHATLPFLGFERFLVLFGLFEVCVGLLFVFPRATRAALVLLGAHLVTTCLPLLVLPVVAWQGFLVPTLEGQYILKNVLVIAAAVTIAENRARACAADRVLARRPARAIELDERLEVASLAVDSARLHGRDATTALDGAIESAQA